MPGGDAFLADLHALEQELVEALARVVPGGRRQSPDDLDVGALLDAQMESRALDHAARWLRGQGLGYYSIGSAGHESNAAVAAALRSTDPALLHYRSGGFYAMRARQVGDHDPIDDVLGGVLALAEEPMAGGRHKVFGHGDLAVIPQTSTIASHLPRAVGVGVAIGRARRLGLATTWPPDAIAVCSFGDASANHSTAQGAINTACYTAHAQIDVPVLFVCEDNGWGISVPTPPDWIEATFAHRPGLSYARCDGTDPVGVFETARTLAAQVRETARPALLHLRTVRYLGHAGTDVESGYRSAASVRADRELDPILATGQLAVDLGLASPAELADRYLAVVAQVRRRALELAERPTLATVEEVIEPLSPRRPHAVARRAALAAPDSIRDRLVTGDHPDGAERSLTLAETINRTLADVLAATANAMVFGEDVGAKGGVYGVTRGLQKRFGAARVFDTLLDEQSILGLALGAGVSGLLPIPEIQYLAYLHNAEDQLRGEAASLSFFSRGRYRNPMVVRIAGYAYQRGFGGHFHNDNAVAVLRDVPGLVIASPSHPSDAAPMLRTCVAAAIEDGTVSAFLEPIALYHERDLFEAGDGVWTAPYAPPSHWADQHAGIGEGRLVRDGDDVLLVSWANGLRLALRAAHRLAADGVSCRVFDLRWLSPMPIGAMVEHALDVGRVVVVDETRRSGGVGEAIVSGLSEAGFRGPIARVAATDSYVPLGRAADLVLVGEQDVVDAVRSLPA